MLKSILQALVFRPIFSIVCFSRFYKQIAVHPESSVGRALASLFQRFYSPLSFGKFSVIYVSRKALDSSEVGELLTDCVHSREKCQRTDNQSR